MVYSTYWVYHINVLISHSTISSRVFIPKKLPKIITNHIPEGTWRNSRCHWLLQFCSPWHALSVERRNCDARTFCRPKCRAEPWLSDEDEVWKWIKIGVANLPICISMMILTTITMAMDNCLNMGGQSSFEDGSTRQFSWEPVILCYFGMNARIAG